MFLLGECLCAFVYQKTYSKLYLIFPVNEKKKYFAHNHYLKFDFNDMDDYRYFMCV